MKREELKKILNERVLVLDGAYGTELAKRGYPDVPEKVVLENPQAIKKLHEDYIRAGANAILTSTFGANDVKLSKFGLESQQEKIVNSAVEIAKSASNGSLIFGDIGPTGELPYPIGEMKFDDYFNTFKKVASLILKAGVDAIILETFTDIMELKAAVLAVRELSKEIFLIAHLTFDENARSLTGTDPTNFALTFNDLDVDAIGVNCSLGPQEILPIFEEISKYSDKMLVVEPDAGAPILKNGKTHYPVGPQDFAFYVDSFWEAKANIIGSCCGSDPTYTAAISKRVGKRSPIKEKAKKVFAFTSPTDIADLDDFVVIGERINPAGRKKLQQHMKDKNMDAVMKVATGQKEAGAKALDVNFGLEQFVDVGFMSDTVNSIAYKLGTPISLDIQSFEALEYVLKRYPGRALVNSSRADEEELTKKLELIKSYGGMLVVLSMEEGVPTSFEDRKRAIEKALKMAESFGISKERLVFDSIILAVGAGASPKETLKAIEYLNESGLKSVVGLSNISFGMPNRSYLNAAFLAMAVSSGLSSAIMNPKDQNVMQMLEASLILNGKSLELKVQKGEGDTNQLVDLILSGEEKKLLDYVDELLKAEEPLNVIENHLKPAMDVIGDMYDKSKIFLPQLILAAQTAQKAFEKVQSLFEKKESSEKFVIATVKGDVHDIGKNIVATILRSAGYDVVDLGRNVAPEKIIDAIKSEKPVMLGLSAMMTTTAPKIQETIEKMKEEGISLPVIVGGASLNEELAKDLGADFYAQNATDAVKALKNIKKGS
ncbi:homocysteine S-methyltransferase family protein [Mesoaciditoga lauensis]|uniref:homocysteine S-methyltransferase family protein n=1 Tax=Mesoaciditoga lauensis TaxID=1495039 RepID=UPI00055F819E|nr:homocysteine S-methyltransferase family protein [Mesoaciditoga lauensis]